MKKSNQVNTPSLSEFDAILFTRIINGEFSTLVMYIKTWFGFSPDDGFTNIRNYINMAQVELILNEFDWEESDQVIANIKRNLK